MRKELPSVQSLYVGTTPGILLYVSRNLKLISVFAVVYIGGFLCNQVTESINQQGSEAGPQVAMIRLWQ
jgi:hypothetical protein